MIESLMDIPIEIIGEIIGHLSIRDLANVIRISKQIRDILTSQGFTDLDPYYASMEVRNAVQWESKLLMLDGRGLDDVTDIDVVVKEYGTVFGGRGLYCDFLRGIIFNRCSFGVVGGDEGIREYKGRWWKVVGGRHFYTVDAEDNKVIEFDEDFYKETEWDSAISVCAHRDGYFVLGSETISNQDSATQYELGTQHGILDIYFHKGELYGIRRSSIIRINDEEETVWETEEGEIRNVQSSPQGNLIILHNDTDHNNILTILRSGGAVSCHLAGDEYYSFFSVSPSGVLLLTERQ
eukprot:TRINITY_DN1690_c0_g1_i1.p1 TRINITY_DN1690_c0_g1~~TRINITY_DN1690_c0_g1_i1.p1  ORF type:complete len:294 (-),score=62.88 TRINITY_DN1690_c0_g1_i1:30-911(-)